MTKLTHEQRIAKAHVTLMRSPEFALLSGVLMCSPTEVCPGVPTAFTDGWRVVIGAEFMDTLDDKTLAWVICHERFHVMLRQLKVWQGLFRQDARRANRAADYVINLLIDDCDPTGKVTTRWPHCCFDEKYRGMDTKQVFDLLAQEPQDGRGNGGDGGDGEPFDEHEWGGGEGVTPEEQEMRDRMIDTAIRQGEMLAGKLGGNVPRAIHELTEPKVDWREPLREFVTSVANDKELSTWRKPNRRWLGQGVYMPTMYSEAVGPIVVAIDTSGSVYEELLTAFISEMFSLCQQVSPERLHLLWWDAEVEGEQVFERGDYEAAPEKAEPKGGGGTDPSCVMRYIEEKQLKPEACVVFTDGYCPFPSEAPEYPVLWAINTNVVAPWGVTVKVEE